MNIDRHPNPATIAELSVEGTNTLNRITDATCAACWRVVGHLDGQPINHACTTPTERRGHRR